MSETDTVHHRFYGELAATWPLISWLGLLHGAGFELRALTKKTSEDRTLRVVFAANSSNVNSPGFDGNITKRPGDGIPLTPRHLFKAFAQRDVTEYCSVDADLIVIGGSCARGSENNAHRSVGVGRGRTAAFNALNIGGEYWPDNALRFFVQIDNVLDRDYFTASQPVLSRRLRSRLQRSPNISGIRMRTSIRLRVI